MLELFWFHEQYPELYPLHSVDDNGLWHVYKRWCKNYWNDMLGNLEESKWNSMESNEGGIWSSCGINKAHLQPIVKFSRQVIW